VGLTVWPLGGLEVNIGGQLQNDLTLLKRPGGHVPGRVSTFLTVCLSKWGGRPTWVPSYKTVSSYKTLQLTN
jgi:hypothetical protein